METQKAFIASSNYIRKVRLPFGVGVIVSFSEDDAMSLSVRRKYLSTRNEWFDINIPGRNTFLNLDALIEEHPEETLAALFSSKALSLLFYEEGQKFFKELPEIIDSRTAFPEERNAAAQDELKKFYDKKITELRQLTTVYALIQFITGRAKNNDMAITSSFLQMAGINGVIYSQDNAERALIFDAKHKIEITRLNSQILVNSRFTEED